jgi:hypothetical protein
MRTAAGEVRGDRFHFIARQIERLDDRAFAALLAWLDGYADSRWAGRCAMDGAVAAQVPATAAAERRAGTAPPRLLDAGATALPAIEWIACEPAAPRAYVPGRAPR